MAAKVGVVIPVYNSKKTLKKCVSSIVNQTFSDWVLMLVDDGSSDGSKELCDQLADEDERILVIHQKNAGSTKARKNGILSPEIQATKYVMLVDSDDLIDKDTLKKSVEQIEQEQADVVCFAAARLYKGFVIKERYIPACFQIQKPRGYDRNEIINEIMISFFGISNYPVWLCAKLHRTEILTKAIDIEPVVKFMGDDLSISIRVVDLATKIVVIPDRFYLYRIGGGSSNYKMTFFDDFVTLYHYKRQYAMKYPIPQDWEYYMNIEMINIVKRHLVECYRSLNIKGDAFDNLVKDVCHLETVTNAALMIIKSKPDHQFPYANAIVEQDTDYIISTAKETVKKERIKVFIKKILKNI